MFGSTIERAGPGQGHVLAPGGCVQPCRVHLYWCGQVDTGGGRGALGRADQGRPGGRLGKMTMVLRAES